MRLINRFKRLTLWNKIGVMGAIASIIPIVLVPVKLFVPSPALTPINVAQGTGSNVVNAGDGNVTITGDVHIQSLDGFSHSELQNLLTQDPRPLVRELDQRNDLSDTNENPSSEPKDSRKWLPHTDTAGSIIESLKEARTFSEYRNRARSLYENRWIPDPGWNGVVHDLPEQDGDNWLVTISIDDSRVFIYAITHDPSGDQWREGQSVTVIGRIREVRYNPFIYVDNATLSPR